MDITYWQKKEDEYRVILAVLGLVRLGHTWWISMYRKIHTVWC
jgi:hypothetical protein